MFGSNPEYSTFTLILKGNTFMEIKFKVTFKKKMLWHEFHWAIHPPFFLLNNDKNWLG